jgi:serine phosphatase RsbU (regulator of sigma subunit)
MFSLLQESSIHQLIRFPEKQASRLYFDSRNCRILFRLLLAFTLFALLTALLLIAEERYLELTLPLVNLLVIRLLYLGTEQRRFVENFRTILIVYFITQYFLLRLLFLEPSPGFLDFAMPFLLLLFRLPRQLLILPLLVMWAFACRNLILAGGNLGDGLAQPWSTVGQTGVTFAVFLLVSGWTDTQHRDFRDRWRREHLNDRERRRMQEELGDARKIQLSMLPTSPPNIPWLDISGLSLPASEVGGDYFGYFQVSPSRFAVVVADVAGHGVASGWVLSGIRACLYLLPDDLQGTPLEPAQILAKLDRVVHQTSGRRIFVTMIYALFDIDEGTVTAVAAGHPPLLCYQQANREVISLGAPSLPLGTALPKNLEPQTIPFGPQDVFLLYTDGVAETANYKEEVYGNERLAKRLQNFARGRSSQEIREHLLGDVVTFKGDREQTDDITVVVVKAC